MKAIGYLKKIAQLAGLAYLSSFSSSILIKDSILSMRSLMDELN